MSYQVKLKVPASAMAIFTHLGENCFMEKISGKKALLAFITQAMSPGNSPKGEEVFNRPDVKYVTVKLTLPNSRLLRYMISYENTAYNAISAINAHIKSFENFVMAEEYRGKDKPDNNDQARFDDIYSAYIQGTDQFML